MGGRALRKIGRDKILQFSVLGVVKNKEYKKEVYGTRIF